MLPRTSDEARALPVVARDALAHLLLATLADSGPSDPSPVGEAAAAVARDAGALVACAPLAAVALCTSGLAVPAPGEAAGGRTAVRRVSTPWQDEAHARLRRYVDALPRVPRGTGLGTRLAQADVLLRAGLFFEVHELLEPEWRRASGRERLVLQGVIQAAVAWHHWQRGNPRAAARLAAAARDKLAGPPPAWRGIALDELRAHVTRWARWLGDGMPGDVPPLPG